MVERDGSLAQLRDVEILTAQGQSRRVSVVDSRPLHTQLGRNFPNPFNPTTTIPFDLSNNGRVRLEIFDILGQRVRVLFADEMLAAGHHAVVWRGLDEEGRDVASGLYFYQLKAGALVHSRSLLLLR